MSEARTFGESLPDQVDRVARVTDAQLHLLSDIREIYKERASLEKDYAIKLQALAKKVSDKKTKRMAALIIGDEPSKQWKDDILRQSTLDYAYTQLVSSLEETAQCHIGHGDALTSQIVESCKSLEQKHEEIKKKQTHFYEKLLSQKDHIYHDRTKTKQKYDEECNEIESHRQKQDRHSQDKHAERVAKQFEQQKVDMMNCKNSYIVSIAVANQYKSKFYQEFLPAVENQYQYIQKNLIKRFVDLLQQAQSLHLSELETLQKSVIATQDALAKVDSEKDQGIFIDYNIREFSLPPDWVFEPCKGYYDTADMAVEQTPKVFLQNKLHRSRTKMAEISPLLEAKKKETDQLHALIDAYAKNPDLGDVDEVTTNYIDSQQQYILLASSACVLQTEIDSIVAALDGDEGSQQPHAFKSASFSIPATCGCCQSTIWGLSKQGKTCKSCGVSVHIKCELKIPADCPGKKVKHSAHAVSTPNLGAAADSEVSLGSVTSLPSAFGQAQDEMKTLARSLYDFTPTSVYELEIHEGEQVYIIEEDDGSGWVKVENDQGSKGLVPATYIELVPDSNRPSRAAFSSSSLPLKSGQYVKGIYPFQASRSGEISVDVGEMIELTDGETGGKNWGDGWAEGVDRFGKTGVFPTTYVEDA